MLSTASNGASGDINCANGSNSVNVATGSGVVNSNPTVDAGNDVNY